MEKEWYKDWFASKDYLDVYRHRNSEDTENLIKLVLSNIIINDGASILDAACGAGRHSIKFAQKGFDVTGFDLSGTLLQIAIDEAEKRKIKINFQISDLRTFNSNIKFDLILSLFTSFGYFNTDEENFAFVRNAFQMLNENGYYVLDYLNKNYLEANLIEYTERKVDGKKIMEDRTIIDGRVVKKISIRKENQNDEYLESVKLYTADELINKFSNIGFKNNKMFGDYLGHNFNIETSERCIIIFQK